MKMFRSSILMLVMAVAVSMLSGCGSDGDDDAMMAYLASAQVEAAKEATAFDMTFAAAVAMAVEGNYEELTQLLEITDIAGSIERVDEHNIATVREIFETGVEDPGARTILLQIMDEVEAHSNTNRRIVDAMFEEFYRDGVDAQSEIFLASSIAMEMMNGDMSGFSQTTLDEKISMLDFFFGAAEAATTTQMEIAKEILCKFTPLDPNRYSVIDMFFDVAKAGQQIYFEGAKKSMEEFIGILEFLAEQFEIKNKKYTQMGFNPSYYLKANGIASMPGYAANEGDYLKLENDAATKAVYAYTAVDGPQVYVKDFANNIPICVSGDGEAKPDGFMPVFKDEDGQVIEAKYVYVVSNYESGFEYFEDNPELFWDQEYVEGLVTKMYTFSVHCYGPGIDIAKLVIDMLFPSGAIQDGMFGLVKTVGDTLQTLGITAADVADEEATNVIVDGIVRSIKKSYFEYCEKGFIATMTELYTEAGFLKLLDGGLDEGFADLEAWIKDKMKL